MIRKTVEIIEGFDKRINQLNKDGIHCYMLLYIATKEFFVAINKLDNNELSEYLKCLNKENINDNKINSELVRYLVKFIIENNSNSDFLKNYLSNYTIKSSHIESEWRIIQWLQLIVRLFKSKKVEIDSSRNAELAKAFNNINEKLNNVKAIKDKSLSSHIRLVSELSDDFNLIAQKIFSIERQPQELPVLRQEHEVQSITPDSVPLELQLPGPASTPVVPVNLAAAPPPPPSITPNLFVPVCRDAPETNILAVGVSMKDIMQKANELTKKNGANGGIKILEKIVDARDALMNDIRDNKNIKKIKKEKNIDIEEIKNRLLAVQEALSEPSKVADHEIKKNLEEQLSLKKDILLHFAAINDSEVKVKELDAQKAVLLQSLESEAKKLPSVNEDKKKHIRKIERNLRKCEKKINTLSRNLDGLNDLIAKALFVDKLHENVQIRRQKIPELNAKLATSNPEKSANEEELRKIELQIERLQKTLNEQLGEYNAKKHCVEQQKKMQSRRRDIAVSSEESETPSGWSSEEAEECIVKVEGGTGIDKTTVSENKSESDDSVNQHDVSSGYNSSSGSSVSSSTKFPRYSMPANKNSFFGGAPASSNDQQTRTRPNVPPKPVTLQSI